MSVAQGGLEVFRTTIDLKTVEFRTTGKAKHSNPSVGSN